MKIVISKISFSFLFLIYILSSCTVQERKYRKGFYLNVKHKLQAKTENKRQEALVAIKLNVKVEEVAVSKQELVASIVKTAPPIPKIKTIKIIKTKNDSCGDLIIMLDHRVIEAKVIEVNQSTIKYKKCNNIDGPTYTTTLEKIERIQYKDGSQDIVDLGIKPKLRFIPKGSTVKYSVISDAKSHPQQILFNKSEKNKFNQTAISSLICGLISFFLPAAIITGPIALITGIIALKQLKNGNGNKGRGMATFGIVIGSIVMVILLIIILAIIAFTL